jgi:hypothetical protein
LANDHQRCLNGAFAAGDGTCDGDVAGLDAVGTAANATLE